MDALDCHSHQFKIVFGKHHRTIHQPGPAGCGKYAGKFGKRNVTPVIVISWGPVNRCLDLLDETKQIQANCASSTRSPVKQTNSGASALMVRTTSAAYFTLPL